MPIPVSGCWHMCHDCPLLPVRGTELFVDGGPLWLPEVVSSGVPDESPRDVCPEAHPSEERLVFEPVDDMAATKLHLQRCVGDTLLSPSPSMRATADNLCKVGKTHGGQPPNQGAGTASVCMPFKPFELTMGCNTHQHCDTGAKRVLGWLHYQWSNHHKRALIYTPPIQDIAALCYA